MSEKSYTPGPWVANNNHSALFVRTRVETDAPGYPNDGWHIADLNGPDAEANARLIAAAPELLESLEAFMDAGVGNSQDQAATADARRMARAAIAKAKGETHAE